MTHELEEFSAASLKTHQPGLRVGHVSNVNNQGWEEEPAAGPAVRRAGAGPAPPGAVRSSQLLGLLRLLGSAAARLQYSLLDLLVHVQHRGPLQGAGF